VGWVTSLVQKAEASQERINEFLKTAPEIVNTQPNEHSVVTFLYLFIELLIRI
jgi:ATP-binding cassette subfamily B protein